MHWTLEVDETFLKVVQKNSIHLARWNAAVQVVRVLKCHVLESVVQTLGHCHSVFSGEASLGRKGRLYYKAEFSTLWVNVKYYMKPATVSFKFKIMILTWNHQQQVSHLKFDNTNSECEILYKTSNNKFQIQNIIQKLKMWKIVRHQRLPVSNS